MVQVSSSKCSNAQTIFLSMCIQQFHFPYMDIIATQMPPIQLQAYMQASKKPNVI